MPSSPQLAPRRFAEPERHRHAVLAGQSGLFLAYYVAYALFLALAAEHHAILPAFSPAMLVFVIPLTAATLVAIAAREARKRTHS